MKRDGIAGKGSLNRWDKKKIVQELRRRHRRQEPLWSRAIRVSHGALYGAARHHFDSYQQAIAAAGIDYGQIQRCVPGRWNPQSVAKELRRLHRLGEPLHHAALERTHPNVIQAAYRNFGGYAQAVQAAGLDYRRIRVRPMPSWDEKRVIKELKQLHRQKHPLWKRALRHTCPYLVKAAKRCFGSYEKAAKATGIDPAALQPPTYRIWSPQRIAHELRHLYRRDPALLKPSRLEKNWPQLLRACRRQLGNYRAALESAGIDYAKVARVIAPPLSAQQILYRLQHLDEQSEYLRYNAMGRKHSRLLNSARYHFGSYRAAVEAAGLDYPPLPPLRHWTRPLVLRALQEMDQKGIDLRFHTMRKKHLPLFEAARYYFGTYLTAVQETGIDYDQMVQEQLHRTLPNRARRIPAYLGRTGPIGAKADRRLSVKPSPPLPTTRASGRNPRMDASQSPPAKNRVPLNVNRST